MDFKKTSIGFTFLLIGIVLIWYAMTLPCDMESITQEVTGPQGQTQEVVISQSPQMARLFCLGTDFRALIALLVGSAMIYPSVGLLIKGLSDDNASPKWQPPKKTKYVPQYPQQ